MKGSDSGPSALKLEVNRMLSLLLCLPDAGDEELGYGDALEGRSLISESLYWRKLLNWGYHMNEK